MTGCAPAGQHEIVELLAARKGHFALESGHHGDLWLDLESLFLRPSRTARFAAELARRLAPARRVPELEVLLVVAVDDVAGDRAAGQPAWAPAP